MKICLVFTAAFMCAAGLPVRAGGQTGAVENQTGWKSLHFSASKWLNRVDTRIDLETVDTAAAIANAPESDRGSPVEASTDRIGRIRIRTTIDPVAGATVELDKKFWFDPLDKSVLFGESSRVGQEGYLRRFRFTSEGVFRFRREPRSPQEAARPPLDWSDTKESFYAYDPQKWGFSQVVEPGVLIYLIGTIDLDAEADQVSSIAFCVFHKRQLFRVSFQHAGTQALDVDYLVRAAGREAIRVNKRTSLVKLALAATPLGDYQGEVEDFSFLGFKKEVMLFFDAAKRLPVLISGQMPTIGRAELRLTAVELSP